MKELTIEEKAKAYDEVFERARLVLQERGNEPDGASILSELFPELAESEKIKGALYKILTLDDANDIIQRSNLSMFSVSNWLEKQGEQKPYGQRQECVDCQFNYAGECKGYCAMKRGEQKLTWSEEDENRFTNLILLVKCSKENDATKEGFIKFINRLKSLKELYNYGNKI